MPQKGIGFAGVQRPADSGNLAPIQAPRNPLFFPSSWKGGRLGGVTIAAISSSFLIKNKPGPLFLFTAFLQFSSHVKIEGDAGSICLKLPNASESIIRVNILWMCFSTFSAISKRAHQAVQGGTCGINIFIFGRNGSEKIWLWLNE